MLENHERGDEDEDDVDDDDDANVYTRYLARSNPTYRVGLLAAYLPYLGTSLFENYNVISCDIRVIYMICLSDSFIICKCKAYMIFVFYTKYFLPQYC